MQHANVHFTAASKYTRWPMEMKTGRVLPLVRRVTPIISPLSLRGATAPESGGSPGDAGCLN